MKSQKRKHGGNFPTFKISNRHYFLIIRSDPNGKSRAFARRSRRRRSWSELHNLKPDRGFLPWPGASTSTAPGYK
jgi:hypothetical protein